MVVGDVPIKFCAAVTVDTPPFSVMDVGDRDSVTARVSSSVMVRITGAAVGAGDGCAVLVAVADTVTDLLAATRSLLLAVMVTAPALLVAPGAMVSVLLADRVKSVAAVPLPGFAAMVIVVVAVAVKFCVAVTVLVAPFSVMDDGDRDSVTTGVSFSVMVRVTLLGAGSVGWAVLAAVADMVTDLLAARMLLSLAVMVTGVPALVVAPAAMVSVLLLDRR